MLGFVIQNIGLILHDCNVVGGINLLEMIVESDPFFRPQLQLMNITRQMHI